MQLTADDYIHAVKRIEKASSWKEHTQQYLLNRLSNIAKLQEQIESGEYTPQNTTDFTINENGHIRLIRALKSDDLVLQHAVSDSILAPVIKDHLIYDTGSGLKDRGLSFTRMRFEIHLRRYFNKFGNSGYALLIDFSKYFDNIDHEKFIAEIQTIFKDDELTKLIRKICTQYEIDVSYSDDENIQDKLFNSLEYIEVIKDKKLDGSKKIRKSLGIGAPIAQLAGLLFPYTIDNYIKTVLGIKYYDVYMDDRIILCPCKRDLEEIQYKIYEMATNLGIFINPKKTRIIPIAAGITWLKVRYRFTKTGKIIKTFSRDILARETRKLRKFNKLINEGKMSQEDAINQYKSWRNNKTEFNCYYRLKHMDEYAERMIGYGRTADQGTTASTGDHKFNDGTYLEHFRNW